MKLYYLLSVTAVGSAFVVPDQEVFSSLAVEDQQAPSTFIFGAIPSYHHMVAFTDEYVSKAFKCAKNSWNGLAAYGEEMINTRGKDLWDALTDASALESDDTSIDLFNIPSQSGPSHHELNYPGKPHESSHCGKPNQTVYELISKSKYTTKLAALINEDEELVQLLNGTTANFTVFAPIDSAFEKIPKHHKKPSADFIKKLLSYHVSTEFYPAGRVLVSRTIPTALTTKQLGGEHQRLSTQISYKGLTVNFYARVVAIDIFGTNGVIHGLDSILIPPPPAVDIISFLPGTFSTLELGLIKTDLWPILNDTSPQAGGTLFTPSNFAFELLGPKINAFLFSKYGLKYLRALLEYHMVPGYTLYSDALYKASDADTVGPETFPKDLFHIDLPTALKDRRLSVDVARYGRFVSISINGFARVAIPDVIADDGAIHILPTVLIPPRTPGGAPVSAEGIGLDELKERLQPFVEAGDASEN